MNFASFTFLFLFLPAFLGIYYLALAVRAEIRSLNAIVLASSLLFYAWGAPLFIPLLLATCWCDYLVSRTIDRLKPDDPRRRRWLSGIVLLNVGFLLYFKYSNFFVDQLNSFLSVSGIQPASWTPVALPIGISFITFEKLSYLFDVYRGRTKPAPTFAIYLLFISLFPHLIAGPIFRYHDLAEQFLNRRHTFNNVVSGIVRFCCGLAKKVLLADPLGQIADRAFAVPIDQLSVGCAWLGIISYTFQIYFDFSGYSDMAIGLGRLIGFRFSENFKHPYSAESITDFWHRWHISLSNWLREYLYYPLGGNRVSTRRTYLNLWIVFLVSGFWHGANWTFIVWGCYHGTFLVLERVFLLRFLQRLPRAVRILITFLIVLFGWVLFRAKTLEDALAFLGRLFMPPSVSPGPELWFRFDLSNRTYFTFFLAAALSFLPAFRLNDERDTVTDLAKFSGWKRAACGLGALCLFLITMGALANSNFHPFIYFQF